MNSGHNYKIHKDEVKKINNKHFAKALRNRINFSLPMLLFVLVILWGMFFHYTQGYLETYTQRLTMQTADNVLNTLENSFLDLEHSALVLSQDYLIKNMLRENDPLSFHAYSTSASQILNTIYQPDGLVDDILIYNNFDNFVKLRGNLGNTAATRIGILLTQNQQSQHVSLAIEGNSYIGYFTNVKNDDEILGEIVFLMNAKQLQTLFRRDIEDSGLIISLIANDNVLACNNDEYINLAYDDMLDISSVYSVREIGATPFSILVVDDGTARNTMVEYFTVSAFITFCAVVIVLLLFYRFLGKNFLTPMLKLMESTNLVGIGKGKLELTGNEDFDMLVDRINFMILRLEEHRDELYEMNYKMQQIEIEKQRSIILSLKKQINSHFTVNTINNIKRLTEIGKPTQAGELCDGLSSLLRYANNVEDYISGFDEMHIIEQFIDIMKIRYLGSFNVHFNIDDELDNFYLPRMLIQPIVENAITHGFVNIKNGHLKISGEYLGDTIVFTVQDNGAGIEKEKLNRLKEKLDNIENEIISDGLSGVALLNIQKRVYLIYGKKYGLNIMSEKNSGTSVSLVLPAKKLSDFIKSLN